VPRQACRSDSQESGRVQRGTEHAETPSTVRFVTLGSHPFAAVRAAQQKDLSAPLPKPARCKDVEPLGEVRVGETLGHREGGVPEQCPRRLHVLLQLRNISNPRREAISTGLNIHVTF